MVTPTVYSSTNPFVSKPDLGEECRLCLYELRHKLSADSRDYRQIAKTDCNHYFHQFCLQDHLRNNGRCPLGHCEKPIRHYEAINLDLTPEERNPFASTNPFDQVPAPTPKPTTPSVSRQTLLPTPKPSTPASNNSVHDCEYASDEEDVVDDLINVGGTVVRGLGWGLWGAAKIGGSILKTGASVIASAFTESASQFDARVQRLYTDWIKKSTAFEVSMSKNREDIAVVLGTVQSLPDTARYNARPIVDRIEANLTSYERSLNILQSQLRQAIAEEKKNLGIR